MICMSREPYAFADDETLHVGAKVAIWNHEDSMVRKGHETIYIPSLSGYVGYIVEIWANSNKDVEYMVIVPQYSTSERFRLYSDELYPLHGILAHRRLNDMSVIYLNPKKSGKRFLIGPKEYKKIDKGQYLKLHTGRGTLSCHVLGSDTRQVIDAFGRDEFVLKPRYIKGLMEDKDFEEIKEKYARGLRE